MTERSETSSPPGLAPRVCLNRFPSGFGVAVANTGMEKITQIQKKYTLWFIHLQGISLTPSFAMTNCGLCNASCRKAAERRAPPSHSLLLARHCSRSTGARFSGASKEEESSRAPPPDGSSSDNQSDSTTNNNDDDDYDGVRLLPSSSTAKPSPPPSRRSRRSAANRNVVAGGGLGLLLRRRRPPLSSVSSSSSSLAVAGR